MLSNICTETFTSSVHLPTKENPLNNSILVNAMISDQLKKTLGLIPLFLRHVRDEKTKDVLISTVKRSFTKLLSTGNISSGHIDLLSSLYQLLVLIALCKSIEKIHRLLSHSEATAMLDAKGHFSTFCFSFKSNKVVICGVASY